MASTINLVPTVSTLTPDLKFKADEHGKAEQRRIVVKFIKEEAAKGEIPSVSAEYNGVTGQFEYLEEPPPSYEPRRAEPAERNEPAKEAETIEDEKPLDGEEDLKEALLKCKDLNLSPRLDIDLENCSWKAVFEQMDQATEKYRKKEEGLKGSLVKLWRVMGRRNDDVGPWLDLIPDEYHLNTVKAGLALCFAVRQYFVYGSLPCYQHGLGSS
jgi:hypothetical protein